MVFPPAYKIGPKDVGFVISSSADSLTRHAQLEDPSNPNPA